MAKAKLAVDVGGTFTDVILISEETNTFTVHKVPSTIHDQSIGVVKGIEEICGNAKCARFRCGLYSAWNDCRY